MNAGAVTVIQAPSAQHAGVGAATAAIPPLLQTATTSSTLPIARCRVSVPLPYYNDIASPGTNEVIF